MPFGCGRWRLDHDEPRSGFVASVQFRIEGASKSFGIVRDDADTARGKVRRDCAVGDHLHAGEFNVER